MVRGVWVTAVWSFAREKLKTFRGVNWASGAAGHSTCRSWQLTAVLGSKVRSSHTLRSATFARMHSTRREFTTSASHLASRSAFRLIHGCCCIATLPILPHSLPPVHHHRKRIRRQQLLPSPRPILIHLDLQTVHSRLRIRYTGHVQLSSVCRLLWRNSHFQFRDGVFCDECVQHKRCICSNRARHNCCFGFEAVAHDCALQKRRCCIQREGVPLGGASGEGRARSGRPRQRVGRAHHPTGHERLRGAARRHHPERPTRAGLGGACEREDCIRVPGLRLRLRPAHALRGRLRGLQLPPVRGAEDAVHVGERVGGRDSGHHEGGGRDVARQRREERQPAHPELDSTEIPVAFPTRVRYFQSETERTVYDSKGSRDQV